jgi:hypothetical protein
MIRFGFKEYQLDDQHNHHHKSQHGKILSEVSGIG